MCRRWVQLRATSPVRQIAAIDRAIREFLGRPAVDSLRAVSVAKQNPYKMWRLNDVGCLEPVVKLADGRESWDMPRQGLPKAYRQNGYIDVTRPQINLQRGTICGTRFLPFIIEGPCVEIDYEDQLDLAEQLMTRECVDPEVSVASPERFGCPS